MEEKIVCGDYRKFIGEQFITGQKYNGIVYKYENGEFVPCKLTDKPQSEQGVVYLYFDGAMDGRFCVEKDKVLRFFNVEDTIEEKACIMIDTANGMAQAIATKKSSNPTAVLPKMIDSEGAWRLDYSLEYSRWLQENDKVENYRAFTPPMCRRIEGLYQVQADKAQTELEHVTSEADVDIEKKKKYLADKKSSYDRMVSGYRQLRESIETPDM